MIEGKALNDVIGDRRGRVESFNEKFQRESTPGNPREEGGRLEGEAPINSTPIFGAFL